VFSTSSMTNFTFLLAEATTGSGDNLALLGQHLLAVVVFSLVGVLILGACFWIMKRLMPFSVTKEIEEDQNTALAIIMGSVIIGMSIIIAAAIL
jgi:putative membrane protein